MQVNQKRLQELLQENFDQLKNKNAAYSLRAYSQKLGQGSGALSAILSGKRRVSVQLARRLSEKLALNPQEMSEVLLDKNIKEKTPLSYLQLQNDQYQYLANWAHMAILSLVKTKPAPQNATEVAQRLGISVSKAKNAIDRLIRLNLLTLNKNGSYQRVTGNLKSTDESFNLSLQRAHHENLNLAAKALDEVEISLRDFTDITMAIDLKNLPLAKEKIRRFQDEISQMLETKNANEVYRMCIQLLPLTKVIK